MADFTTPPDSFSPANLFAQGEVGAWVDYSDRSTWFEDEALTIPTDDPERVRYFANKVGPGVMGPIGMGPIGLDIRRVTDIQGNGHDAVQPDPRYRPTRG
jgi:hypothetical protein